MSNFRPDGAAAIRRTTGSHHDSTRSRPKTRQRHQRNNDRKLAIAYARGSTEACALQLAEIESWATEAGVQVVASFTDEGHASRLSAIVRPGLLKALRAVRAERAGWLVVKKRGIISLDGVVGIAVDNRLWAAGGRVAGVDGEEVPPEWRDISPFLLPHLAALERNEEKAG